MAKGQGGPVRAAHGTRVAAVPEAGRRADLQDSRVAVPAGTVVIGVPVALEARPGVDAEGQGLRAAMSVPRCSACWPNSHYTATKLSNKSRRAVAGSGVPARGRSILPSNSWRTRD